MHVTPNTPRPDRLAVMLAQGVLYAGQAAPTVGDAPPTLDTDTGPWTPTPHEWANVCDRVADLVHAAVGVRLVDEHTAARGGPTPALVAHLVAALADPADDVSSVHADPDVAHAWATAPADARAAVLLALAWLARTVPVDEADERVDPLWTDHAVDLVDLAVDHAAAHTDEAAACSEWFGDRVSTAPFPGLAGVLAHTLAHEADTSRGAALVLALGYRTAALAGGAR